MRHRRALTALGLLAAVALLAVCWPASRALAAQASAAATPPNASPPAVLRALRIDANPPGSLPAHGEWPYALLIVLLLLLLIGIACFRARLSGTLSLTHPDGSSGTLELGPSPFAKERTVIGRPGLVKVRGAVFRPEMKVTLRLDNGAQGTRGPVEWVWLSPGEMRNVNGVDIGHTPASQRRESPEWERR